LCIMLEISPLLMLIILDCRELVELLQSPSCFPCVYQERGCDRRLGCYS